MLRLIRALWRVLRPREAPPATLHDLQLRIDSLEGDLEHLVKEHVKLRGRVTGGVRRPKEQPEGGAEDQPPMPAPVPNGRTRSLRAF